VKKSQKSFYINDDNLLQNQNKCLAMVLGGGKEENLSTDKLLIFKVFKNIFSLLVTPH